MSEWVFICDTKEGNKKGTGVCDIAMVKYCSFDTGLIHILEMLGWKLPLHGKAIAAVGGEGRDRRLELVLKKCYNLILPGQELL
jgi:hypothetical protein